jgi:pentapeptide MXKDX repeat protein
MLQRRCDSLSNSELLGDKMPNDKMPNDKMPNDKMPNDKMPNDKMPNDKMPNDKMPNNKMSKCKLLATLVNLHMYISKPTYTGAYKSYLEGLRTKTFKNS